MEKENFIRNEGTRERRNKGLLCRSYVIFVVGIVLFVSYVAIDHSWERQKLQDSMRKMEQQLAELNNHSSYGRIFKENDDVSEFIHGIIDKKRRCDSSYATNQLIKSTLRGDVSRNEKMKAWIAMPKPLIHLSGRSAKVGLDKDNIDGMLTVKGWIAVGSGGCSENDPYLENDNITIRKAGYYNIYSQITFRCQDSIPGGRRPSIHRHVVQHVQEFARFYAPSQILMETVHQLCGKSDQGKLKVSRHGGVFWLTEKDSLRVVVDINLRTSKFDDATFSMVML